MRSRRVVLLLSTVVLAGAGVATLNGGISPGVMTSPAADLSVAPDVSSNTFSRSGPVSGMIAPRHTSAFASQRSECPEIATRIHVGAGVTSLASGDGALWVSGFGAISRLDPATGRLIAVITTPGSADYSQIAVSRQAVWVTASGRGVVYRINPLTHRVTATLHVGGSPQGIAVGGGQVWVTLALAGPGKLIAIDPSTGRESRPPITVGLGPGQVLYRQHAVWVQNTSPASVMRINPATGQVTTVIGTVPVSPGSPGPGAIAVGYGPLWSVANSTLSRLAPSSSHVIASLAVARGLAIAIGDREVWVLSYPRSNSPTLFEPIKGTAAVCEIDPHSDRTIGRPIRLHALQPIAITATRRSLWIANFSSSVTRLRLAACQAPNRRAPRVTRRSDPYSSAHRRNTSLPRRLVNRADGVAVRYPAGWRVDQRPLTRLISPRQLLVISSFAIRQRHPDPNCTPKTAISELPATGALLFLLEQPHAGKIGPNTRSFFGLRPAHFHLERLTAQDRECFGESRELNFRSAGRQIYLLAYFGQKASQYTKQLADRTLDSLVLRSHMSQ